MNRTLTITELRKLGWTCVNANAGKRGYSGLWTISKGDRSFEVDLGEANRWIVAYNGGRDGFDAPSLGEALAAIPYTGV